MALKLALAGLILLVNITAGAEEFNKEADEAARIERIRNAQSIEEAVDNMTPDEIAHFLGLPTEAEFTEMLQSDPELLFQQVSNGPALVNIFVNISTQRIYVNSPENAQPMVSKISSGISGHATKRGCYTPYRMHRVHTSTIYNAPMPNSVFYYGPYAIHGTFEENRLGRPASRGCVRVSRAFAGQVFNLVQRYRRENTRICVCSNEMDPACAARTRALVAR